MKNIRLNLKTLVPILLMILFAACKKEKKDYERSPECSQKGTVVYLPIGCVGPSDVLGILDDKGTYYEVVNDQTGRFSSFKENDPICFDFEESTEPRKRMGFCGTGIMAFPTKSINLTCVSKCKKCEESGCKKAMEVTSFEYKHSDIMIADLRQEGNSLKMTISFSGCDDSLDPDFLYKPLPNAGIVPAFQCRVPGNGMNTCLAVFTKEVCFDISSILDKYVTATLTIDQSSGNQKTITVKR